MSLPWSDIMILDCILGFLYLVAAAIIMTLAVVAFVFIVGFLMFTCPVWLPILIIVVLICNIFGIGVP